MGVLRYDGINYLIYDDAELDMLRIAHRAAVAGNIAFQVEVAEERGPVTLHLGPAVPVTFRYTRESPMATNEHLTAHWVAAAVSGALIELNCLNPQCAGIHTRT